MKYLNITLNTIALIAIGFLAVTHFEYNGWYTILFAVAATAIGYLLGMWTCHLHKKNMGFWITIIIFVVLNLLHSAIDGTSITSFTALASVVAILSHELARQPALYLVLWGMLTPFATARQYRILIVPIAVTGVWMIGVSIGHTIFADAGGISWIEPLADQAMFLFLGDILHHLYEEYGKLKHQTCCHDIA